VKIEYFHDGSPDCPLVLLYGIETDAVKSLVKEITAMIEGHRISIAVHELGGFESVDGCQLHFRANSVDTGISLPEQTNRFECSLQSDTWAEVVDFLEPFCRPKNAASFQWLSSHGKINLLISTHRGW
jgi:hypothetical protein